MTDNNKNKMLDGKIALITGASRGIGAQIAKQYAKNGAKLILTSRTISGLESTDDEIKQISGQNATIVPLDLMEYDKIDELGGVIANRFKKLDILVLNAGFLGDLSPLSHMDPKIWDKTIATNLTANYRMIRSFAPLLGQSEAPKVIVVSSGIVNEDLPFWSVYNASKAALEKIMLSYAKETAKTPLRLSIVRPMGWIDTKMMDVAMPGGSKENARKPEELVDIFVKLASNNDYDTGSIFEI